MLKKMKKLICIVRQELYKTMTNYIFIVSVIGIMLMIMSGTIFTESITTKSYNFFQILTMDSGNRAQLLTMYQVTFDRIFLTGTQGYLWMFVSVFVSSPFVMLMCTAKKNNNIRFEIFRAGKTEYVLAKCISAMISGGLVMSLGYVLFSVGIRVLLPADNLIKMTDYVKRFMEMFFYGMTSTCITYILSGFMRNKYLVICIPFMLNYFMKTWLDRSKYWGNKIAEMMRPTAPEYLFSYDHDMKNRILIFWICLFLAGIILYRIALERRCDCGE